MKRAQLYPIMLLFGVFGGCVESSLTAGQFDGSGGGSPGAIGSVADVQGTDSSAGDRAATDGASDVLVDGYLDGGLCDSGSFGHLGDPSCEAECEVIGEIEQCNGLDDDCNGIPDDSFPCVMDAEVPCPTTCGTVGSGRCSLTCEVPTGTACAPPTEVCNGRDDDCAGGCDDGFECCLGEAVACTTACGSAGSQTCGAGCGFGPCEHALAEAVDASTLEGKLVMGYQGWFSALGDGSLRNQWRHWSPGVTPAPDTITFDAWPDLSEYGADELYATDFRYADGATAGLYSAHHPVTVCRHFNWMAEYGVDGVFLQQFVVELAPSSAALAFREQVTDNVRAGAEAHGRVFAIMYDISGADPVTLVSDIQRHWGALVDRGVIASDRYLHHRGRPLVAIWGLGFSDRPASVGQASALLAWFETEAPEAYRASTMGGVPSGWRTLEGDAEGAPGWADVYARFDVISPWTVGRFGNDADVRSYRRDRIVPDLAEADALGADYLPVIFPGFSWTNLNGGPLNQIPRRGGRFFWTQVHEFYSAGASMLYVAMFDEVDEATAMFKIAETAADSPAEGRFLTLDADGEAIPSDFYLRLAGEAGRVLRGERESSPERPLMGGEITCEPPDSVLIEGRCVPSCGAAGGDSCDSASCAGRPLLEAYDCEVCCALDI